MKKQSRKIGVAGGFFNQMMGNNATEPKVGEGATILFYSDREAYEVIEVSEDGLNCVIREMECTYCGSGYGDEKYTYASDVTNQTMNLEWNDKKACWGSVTHTVEVIKALSNKLFKEHGYGAYKHLPIPYKELIDGDPNCSFPKLKLVEGITKEYKNFHAISIIFGTMDKYRDPSF